MLLDTSIFPADIGWRLAFGMGVVLGFAIMIVRRKVPESPRWLFIHGREDEAERIVTAIEQEAESDGAHLEEPGDEIEIRQRERIPFREIARVAFTKYPKRATLGIALFVGQAFLYNGVTFNLGTLFATFYGVSSSTVPIFIIAFALGNFAGPLTLGRLFDTVGRKPMITITYVGSAALTVLLAVLFTNGSLSKWSFEALIVVTFFVASAGASAAYLTVSEIFPMETRALAIAFFYAVGTAIGGITGPLLFGELIGSGDRGQVAIAFYIGAAAMAVGGIAELFFGVRAEGQSLEDIARPLTATDQDEEQEPEPRADKDEVNTAARARREQTAERDRRARERLTRHAEFESHGRRRYRPGGGATIGSRGFGRFPVTPGPDYDLDREIDIIERTLAERGPLRRAALADAVGARFWGPGRFRRALRFATEEGAARQVSSDTFDAGDRAEAGAR